MDKDISRRMQQNKRKTVIAEQTGQEAQKEDKMDEQKIDFESVKNADPGNPLLIQAVDTAQAEGWSYAKCQTEFFRAVSMGLNHQEKTLCKNLGITEESYIAQKNKEN